MASNCLDKSLLLNSGTSQVQRNLEALAYNYVHVDERTDYSSLILFAKNYSAYLNFYSLNNTVTGDWQDIMGSDVAVTMATIGSWNTKDYLLYISNLYDYINTPDAVYSNPEMTFKYLFDFIFSISAALNESLSLLPATFDYLKFLQVSIGSKLAVPLAQLVYYYNQFVASGYLIGNSNVIDPNMPVNKVAFFPSLTFLGSIPWKPLTMVSSETIINIPLDPSSSVKPQVQIINSSLFSNIVNNFINGIEYIVIQTETTYINETLTNYPDHAPQYALYLTFLRLFHKAQDHLNTFTGRHLEFYYKKVLQLANNQGISDKVHLVFQLQKNTLQYLLAQGNQFKAGKDANNNDLFYSLTKDIVLNQASVQLLKSLNLSKKGVTGIQQILYASPIANSADGQGAKLTSPDQSWYPFGDPANASFIAVGATLGFAIASNLLYLNEGSRTIKLSFNCTRNIKLSSSDLTNLNSVTNPSLFIQLTGNKNWFDAASYSPTGNPITISIDPSSAQKLVITIVLNGTAPPVIPYSQKIHGGSFTQPLPMVRVQLVSQTGYNFYAVLKSLVISSIDIDVEVTNLQNLVLQNKDGKIDPSKPFKPFGEYPPQGSPFIVGSKEVFQKKLTALTLNITWQSTNPSINVNNGVLVSGQWQSGAAEGTLGTSINVYDSIIPISATDFTANESYTITSVNGFLELQLSEDKYDISSYLSSTKAITVNVGGSTSNLVYTVSAPATPPVSPIATSVNLYYKASGTLALDSSQASPESYNNKQYFFYHIEPFGIREMHPQLTSDAMNILSVFNLDDGQSADNGGELWIGLVNTQPGQTHSILYQVGEGTANPLKDVTTVNWFYMRANNWIPFTSPIDNTNNLTQSGLVVLNMPGDETTSNTRADNGILWLKAVVRNNPDAVCKIIAVLANAAEAQFIQTQSDSFTVNIPAQTISKLAVANAVIQQINQPYPSFGGRPVETDQQFNLRVSERLRHKNRGVTAWDYERIVLQHFPQVHKVKCLNHTTLNTKTTDYSELKPGSVMIVTIPELSQVTGANPLLPFTNIGLLETIREFLEPHLSPFVRLEVCNPQFEGVQLDFCVTFINNNANANYYIGVLNTDIEQFLMPWAFGSQEQDIEFGGKIEKSALINFVQERPYVDFVTCFKMNQYIYTVNKGFSIYKQDVEEAIASTARSILVPYNDPLTGTGNLIVSQVNCNCND